MLALIAGTGDLPRALLAALPARPLVCALSGFLPDVTPDVTFRIEHLGTFLNDLRRRGVTQICMAGAIRRPPVNLRAIDLATWPLVPTIWRALNRGDDGALRGFIAVLERRGFAVMGAHEVAPDLFLPPGIPTRERPSFQHENDAHKGEEHLVRMGAIDLGQACVIRDGRIVVSEDDAGTDAMLRQIQPSMTKSPIKSDPFSWSLEALAGWFRSIPHPLPEVSGGILFKGPKPAQDRRVDLPVIGLRTVMEAAAAGLAGVVIEADGVMVLDQARLIDVLDTQGMFLWVRPRGGA